MDSGSSSFLGGFGMIVLGLALMARSPAGVHPEARPVVLSAARLGSQSPGGILDLDCTAGEGQRTEAPFGLTLCRGAGRTTVRSEQAPQPGARIVATASQGLGAAAGLTVNDVIYQVAGVRVTTGTEAHARLTALPPNQTAVINFWRDGMPFLVRIRPDTPSLPAGVFAPNSF
jgi:hypothetical protein